MTMSDVDAGPDAPPDARRRPPWVVVIALVAVLAVVAVLVSRCASGGGDGATPVPSTLDAPTVTAIGDAVTKAVEAQSQVVAEVYRRIQPSVVEIDVEQSATVTTAGRGERRARHGRHRQRGRLDPDRLPRGRPRHVDQRGLRRRHPQRPPRSSPPTRSTTSPLLQPATLPQVVVPAVLGSAGVGVGDAGRRRRQPARPDDTTTAGRDLRRSTARYRADDGTERTRADPVRRRGQPGQLRRPAAQRRRAR